MSKNPFFSVVMPVYGVEKYLEDSVNSVLNQSFDDFEVILVDDCSPDKSGEICDSLAENEPRIKVLHLAENGGLSNARNKGFEAVNGKFVFFMDSDDTVSENLLSEVYSAIEKNSAEVTVFGIHEEYFGRNGNLTHTADIAYGEDLIISEKSELRKTVIELEKKTLYGYAWNKIYDADYLRKIGAEFKKITLIEDILYNIDVFNDIERLNILDFTPYNYKKRINESLTNKFLENYFKLNRQRVEMILNQYKGWGICDNNVKTILADIYSRYIFSALQRNCDERAAMKHSDRKKWLDDLYKDELWQELSPYFTLDNSLQGILSRLLKTKSKLLCLFCGRFIFTVKEKLPGIFAKAKTK